VKTAPSIAKVVAEVARASCSSGELVLRANGGDVTTEVRDEMLRRCAAGEYVELELDLLAFEQRPGVSNRNFIRFRDGALMAMGRSGVGTPFLRNHDQWDTAARGGTIASSRTEKRGEGDYAIRQTVKLTAPWAVDSALRGLMSTLSIGWRSTGPVLCTVCNANFYRCAHMPGTRYAERDDGAGGRVVVADPAGPMLCEVLYTAAELVETSDVNVPAVPSAQIEEIRAALAADPSFCAPWAPDAGGSGEENQMKNFAALVAMLGLAATAGEDEVLRAVEALKRDRDTQQAKLQIAETERARLAEVVQQHSATERKHAEDKFIRDALSTGRITVGDESMWRRLYAVDEAGAKSEMDKRVAGCAMPVGIPTQSKNDPSPAPAVPAAPAQLGADAAAELAQRRVDPGKVVEIAGLFGVKNPAEAVAAGLKKGA
jgi:hypothetical protein